MLLEHSVCLLSVVAKGRQVSSFCLHSSPALLPVDLLTWFPESWCCLCCLWSSIVTDALISSSAVIFSLVLYFFGALMDLGKRRNKCYRAVAHCKSRSSIEKDVKIYLLFSGWEVFFFTRDKILMILFFTFTSNSRTFLFPHPFCVVFVWFWACTMRWKS